MPISAAAAAGAPRGAVVPIASTVLTSQGTNITFSNIPQIYQDLMLVVTSRINSNIFLTMAVNVYFNTVSQSPTGWSSTRLSGDGVSATSGRTLQSGPTYGAYVNTPSAIAGPGTFGTGVFHILNYANSSFFKPVLVQGANDTSNGGGVEFNAGTFASTSPVTTIQIGSGYGAPYFEGSSFSLYGIRRSGQ